MYGLYVSSTATSQLSCSTNRAWICSSWTFLGRRRNSSNAQKKKKKQKTHGDHKICLLYRYQILLQYTRGSREVKFEMSLEHKTYHLSCSRSTLTAAGATDSNGYRTKRHPNHHKYNSCHAVQNDMIQSTRLRST
jgi:hypothetical protein